MKHVRLLGLIWIIAGLIVACSNARVPGGEGQPNAETGQRLYVRSVLRPYIYGVDPGGWRHTYLLLLEDGTAYRGLPKGVGIGGISRDELLAIEPERVGSYRETGSRLEVAWQDGIWALEKDGNDWRRAGEDEPFSLARALPNATFEGAYASETGAVLGFGPDPAAFGHRARFVFFADGRFVYDAFTGGSGSGAVGVGETRASGDYRLQGYGLELRYDDGTVDHLTAFIWSDTDDSILSLGRTLFQQEPMPEGITPDPGPTPQPPRGISGAVTAPVSVRSGAVVVACPILDSSAACDDPNAATTEVAASGRYALGGVGAGPYAVLAFLDLDADGRLGGGDLMGVYSADGQQASAVTPPATDVHIRLEPLRGGSSHIQGRVFAADGSSPSGSLVIACPVRAGDLACGDVNAVSAGAYTSGTYRLEDVADDTYVVLAVKDANGSGELDAGDLMGFFGAGGDPAVTPPADGIDIQMERVTQASACPLESAGLKRSFARKLEAARP